MSSHSKTLSAVLLVAGTLFCLVFFFFPGDRPADSANHESGRPPDSFSESPKFPTEVTEEASPITTATAPPVSVRPFAAIPPASPIPNIESLEAFLSWIDEYRELPVSDRSAIIDRGLALAGARRSLIRQLIHENPEMALAHSLTLDQYHALPAEVRALVEKPFSARAGIDVFPRCDNASATRQSDLKTSQHVDLHVTLNSARSDEDREILDAFTWGWRLEAPSRSAAPVQGIQLDGLAAIRESVFQPLQESEIPVAENLFPVANPSIERGFATGRPLLEKPVVALAAGWLFYFADRPAFEEFQETAASLETRLGPENGSGLIFENLAATIAGPEDDAGGFDFVETKALADKIENQKIAGNRKVLMIRVDFSNKTGSPIGTSTLQNRMDGEVDDQCKDMSFNRLSLTTTVEAPLVRMPHPTTYYNGTDDGSKKNSALYNDAIAAAAAAGINTSGYNHRCIIFKSIGMGYCGLATVGGSKIWLPCHSSKVIVHELGHNFGVGHASFHDPDNDNDPLGAGSSSEYGDNTDIMGGGGVSSGHFHSQFKTKLAWLDGNQRFNFNSGNTNNTYRIYRFDHPDTAAANARRAVRVYRGTNNEYLWINYRQRFGGSNYQNYLKGAQVYWQKAGKNKSWLLDLTPGGGKNNSGLGLGRTFSDTRKDIHITALKRGGSSPNQWLDVQVTRGPFGGNGAPSISAIRVPARVPVNESIVVGAAAADPDSDPLAYFFDFKDNTVVGNDGTAASRNYTWTSKGTKNLTVTVSDRKGQTATQTVSVTVQNRLNPPANLSASDSNPSDRIQLNWDGVSGGTSFAIYRSLSSSTATARQIGTASTNSYADTTATPETTYYYWVQALGSGAASNLSGPDAGKRSLISPDPPQNLTATEGTYADRIELNWQSGAFADRYEIYRGTTLNPDDASQIGESTIVRFTDTTAERGIYYYYWIRSVNSVGSSELSEAASGHALPVANPPPDFSAGQGAYPDRIELMWQPATHADYYEIYRGIDPDSGQASKIGQGSATGFTDLTADQGVVYFYWIRGVNAGGPGDFGDAATGYRRLGRPANVAATEGASDREVIVTWSAVAGAEEYEILRSDSTGAGETLIGTTSDLSFADLPPDELRKYDYSIRAKSEIQGSGDPSAAASGFRTIPPPDDFVATDGYYDDRVRVNWTALSETTGVSYKVYRSTDPGGDGARLLGRFSGAAMIDRTAEAGVEYFYFLRAILETATITGGANDTIERDLASSLSPAEPGHRSAEIQFRPDGLIGKRPTSLLGNNIHNLSGANQQLRALSKRGRKVSCYLAVQNDGKAAPGRIRVTGSRSNRFFRITYRDISRGAANVTAQITQALYVARLDAGADRTLKIEIKPSRLTRGKKKRRRLSILTSSTEVSGRSDVVGVLIKTR